MCSDLDSYRTCEVWADRLLHGELQQLLFPWRDIEICDAAKDTPISENSSSSQFNITKAFRLN